MCVCVRVSSRCTTRPIWVGAGGLQTEDQPPTVAERTKGLVGPWPLSWEGEDLQLDTS